jgi:hypothetical protein
MDFVDFNLAKRLKEKGFNVPCIYAYCEKGGWNMYTQKHEPITYILRTNGNPFGSYYVGKNWNKEYTNNKNKIQCSAPTISQILKWLREEKKISIEISIHCSLKWMCSIYGFSDGIADFTQYNNDGIDDTIYILYDSYEQASLAGIEYVLDNLI